MQPPALDHDCPWSAYLRRRVDELEAKLAADAELVVTMKAELDQLRRKVFGRSSEKMPSAKDALRKQNDALDAAPKKQDRGEEKRKANAEAKAKLPEREMPHAVPPDQQTCPKCGKTELKPVGVGRISFVYEYVPPEFERQKHVQQTLACTCGDHVITAPGPDRVIDKSIYGPHFIAHVVTAKCGDSIPLYRMEKQLKRLEIPMSRSTMCDLFHRCAELLHPIYARLLGTIAHEPLVQADETTLRVQDKGKTRRSYLWTFLSGKQIAYVYSPSRSGQTPAEVLGGTRGTLVVDGYTGYNQVSDVDGRDRAGCMAHARRKFFDALQTAPDEATAAMEIILDLYRVEHDAAEKRILGTDAHLQLRRERSAPIMQRLRAWLDEQTPLHRPTSPIAKAIQYTTNQWKALSRFLDDAMTPLDNNASERALRVAALGRKNFLFVGNDQAGRNTAVLYSLVSTCEALGVNPEAYLADVLIRSQTHPQSRLDELLPANWAATTAAPEAGPPAAPDAEG